MRLIDSHAHLTSDAFAGDLDDVIGRMKAAGLIAAVTIACDDEDREKLLPLLARHSGYLYGAWALHPEYPDHREPDVDEIAEWARKPGMVAVGETGLDFYWCKEPLDWQRDRFRRHIAAAKKAGRPLIVHARDAEAAALEILVEEKAADVGFVLHCFSSTPDVAARAVAAGGMVSFTGNLTFKKNEALRAVAAAVPIGRLMVETDCPYMAPVPFRGKRCDPSMVGEVARTIAQAKGIGAEEAAEETTRNALRFFGLREP